VGEEIQVFDATLYGNVDSAVAVQNKLLVMALDIDPLSGLATITGREASPQAKAVSELPLADVSFVNYGSDLLVGQTIPAAIAGIAGEIGVAAFATVGYSWQRTETGSHVDVKGFSGDVGIAVGAETSVGPFAAGLFLEFGKGSYDSFNEFNGFASVRGEGDLSYLGGGAFARLDLGAKDASRPYFEASFRFGRTDGDFGTRDFEGTDNRPVDYDLDSDYFGFHAGGGYVIAFSGFDGTLDLSAKYFHLRRDGDDFTLLGGDATLSSVTSSRIKAGGRLTVGITPVIRTYFGAYFEHELDGDSRVTFMDVPLPEASLGGSTGIGELGLLVSSPGGGLEFQIGVQGSAGRRDSFSGNMSLRYTF
jgi:hypothetical protein